MSTRKSKASLERELKEMTTAAQLSDNALKQHIANVARAIFGDMSYVGKTPSDILLEIGRLNQRVIQSAQTLETVEKERDWLRQAVMVSLGEEAPKKEIHGNNG